jgi:UDP-N-acetylglucosamine--N-acetylmuramyl-(pentapeptide) pyrophosphoryl-undecaprenol N-acetylglucosamine transferase
VKKRNVVISGGGTGGHIYPGLALAEYLKNKYPDISVHFIGAEGGLEEKIIPQYAYPLHLLRVGRLHKSVGLWKRIKSFFILPLSFIQSLKLYLKLKPLWVLGVGGFASGPFLFTAALVGGKTAILEPNAFPGMTNRLLSRIVNRCFVVFEEAKNYFPNKKVHIVGLPVRFQKKTPLLTYNNNRPLKILIFGGSQGSRAINKVVGDWVEQLGDDCKKFEIFHQIGAVDFAIWKKRYANKHQTFLEYVEYINDMPKKLEWADLVICRSGVGSVVEIAMMGKPAIFIPLPTAADNHQFKNAEVLVNKNAAFMLEEKNLNSQSLNTMIMKLAKNPGKLKEVMDELVKIDFSNAQEDIIKILMNEAL